jgi:hypothetical protein
MIEINGIIKMLHASLNLEAFEHDEKQMFLSAYQKLHHHESILQTVRKALGIISKMLTEGWDREMTFYSILLMNQENHNSFHQKMVLLDLSQELESKYYNNGGRK